MSVENLAQSSVDPVVELYKRDVDRTLIRENLKLTVEQRFDNLMRMQEFALQLRGAMLQATTAKR
jgi:hypothetical protein